MTMEVPVGFEPAVKDLQSCALPTWLRNHRNKSNTNEEEVEQRQKRFPSNAQ